VILSLQSEYLPAGSASPGACYFCNAARRQGEAVVDFHLQVDVAQFDGTAIDGWLQACSTCMAEVGRLIGMAPADEVAALRSELALEQDRRRCAEQLLDEADTALDALKVYRSRRPLASGEDAA
jgi:hypothetical protein